MMALAAVVATVDGCMNTAAINHMDNTLAEALVDHHLLAYTDGKFKLHFSANISIFFFV